ncbi:MAG: hypothetical protein ACJA0U_003211 [Salibacteraceae bacterium]|jgi:hypothetical protein
MTLEEKQQDIIYGFSIFNDWIRESTAFEGQTAVKGTTICPS